MKLMTDFSQFRGAMIFCLCALSALIIPVLAFPGDEDNQALSRPVRAMKWVRKDMMPPEERDQTTAGYYEDLFSFSSRTVASNRLLTGKWATNWSRYEPLQMNRGIDQRVNGFLYIETKPNLNVVEFNVPLLTNQYGMVDREYSLERPEGVRRVSFIGDSITRGLGASFGKNFEALLEEKMNAERPVPGVERYEFLNFSVGGYRITQLVSVLETKAATFHPQAHVVVLTDLAVFRKWGDHIVQLVHDGLDLQYPFLKDLVARAGLHPNDDPQTFDAKLAPYHDDVFRWALETMKTSARKQGSELVVFLVHIPDTSTPESRDGFASLRKMGETLDIPVVDASDVFDRFDDLNPYRVAAFNRHPNDAGHALLAERIYERLRENPRAWSIITGAPATTR